MLSLYHLKEYASMRGLSLRDLEAYCSLGAGHISHIFNGTRPLTEENYREIVKAINSAYAAKVNGTFKRPALDKNKNAIGGKSEKGKTLTKRAERKTPEKSKEPEKDKA